MSKSGNKDANQGANGGAQGVSLSDNTPESAARRASIIATMGVASRRKRSLAIGLQIIAESVKEKQARAKEHRTKRKALLDGIPATKHIVEMLAFALDLDQAATYEIFLDYPKNADLMHDFSENGGRRTAMFYLQDAKVPHPEDCGRMIHAAGGKKENEMKRIFGTTGNDIPFSGECILFTRATNDEEINQRNAGELVTMQTMSGGAEGGMLDALQRMLTKVYEPACEANEEWGDLSRDMSGKKVFRRFRDNCDSFVQSLQSAAISANEVVRLDPCEKVDLSSFNNVKDCITAAGNAEIVSALEETVNVWCKQVEQVLTESKQIRKEADDTGPMAELDHWRQLKARYSSLLEQIKSKDFRMVVSILRVAKSKVLNTWRELDSHITDAGNEAKDNMRYLYTLEKFFEPLYNCDPIGMTEAIPRLINAIRMIYNISRFYNTSERMTSLLIKVTNQMVKSCKSYITDDGLNRVWDQSRQDVIKKVGHCTTLYVSYQQAFQKAKAEADASPEQKSFEFSEMYIFGKFDAFCKRLNKIVDLLNTIETYWVLQDCRIEGVEPMLAKFQTIYGNIKKKPYNILDHRKLEFDSDYTDFNRGIADLNAALKTFMQTCFKRASSTTQALKLLERFAELSIPSLGVDAKYQELFLYYSQEIEHVKQLYQQQYDNPPTQRNMPPVSGKIAWARQCFRKISEPMEVFKNHREILRLPEAKKIIRKYNHVAEVLVKYEMVYHQAWIDSVLCCRDALQVPLLVRHPKTGKLLINLDPGLHMVGREADWMRKLELEIPHNAAILIRDQETVRANADRLQLYLDEYESMEDKIPAILQPLLQPILKELGRLLRPGITSLTWTSLNIQDYFASVRKGLDDVQLLLKKILDIKEIHIDAYLKEIGETMLCDLPEKEPWTVDQLLANNKTLCSRVAKELNCMVYKVEQAVGELIKLVVEAIERCNLSVPTEPARTSPAKLETSKTDQPAENKGESENEDASEDVNWLQVECDELTNHFNQRCLESLLRATRLSLDLIRRKIFLSSGRTGDSSEDEVHFVQASMCLTIPTIVMQPNLDEIQQALNKVTQMVLGVSRGVARWGQERYRMPSPKEKKETSKENKTTKTSRRKGQAKENTPAEEGQELQPVPIPPEELQTYYKAIAENKEVNKVVRMLTASVNSFRTSISEALESYDEYSFLWKDDRELVVKEFVATNPILSDFKAEITKYIALEKAVEEIPIAKIVGPVELSAENLKLSLRVEIQAWTKMLGRHMNLQFKHKMDAVAEFQEEHDRKLSHAIKDLEDVRQAMMALEAIRQKQIEIDMSLGPIEEAYALLQKFGINVPKEETDRVDTLRYSVNKMISQASYVQSELVVIQPKFKAQLLDSVVVFLHDVDTYQESYETEGPMVEGIPPQEASDRLNMFQSKFEELWRLYQTYSAGEDLFGLPVTEYPFLGRIKKELTLLQKLYSLYNTVMVSISGYYDILWTEVDIEKIKSELVDFSNRCRKLPKGMKDWQAFMDLKRKIDNFNESCPILELMANRAMKERHWDRIAKTTGHTFDYESDNFLLRNIMEAPILQHKEDIEDICISAVKEKDIEAKLKQVIADWSAQVINFSVFKQRGELLLKPAETAEIVALMEDSLMILSSLLSNRYNAPFKKTIQDWVQKLSNTSDIIEMWMTVQNLWVYLEAVFVGGDIAKQLPQEAKRFTNIDKSWVKIMTRAHEVPNVVQCCVGDETLGQLLPHLLEQLELCQKSLTGYLESKRLVFPRFFFISDPALLEILGQASDSHTIQAHLLGIFENVFAVDFHEKDYDQILACVSKEGERIPLETPVQAKGNVELWLGQLLTLQQRSLHNIIREASFVINDPTFNLLNFINNYIAQVGLLGIQMMWTRDAEEALKNARHDKKIMQTANMRFLDILNTLIEQTTRDLGKFERIKYETLITIHVHQRDIFDDLVRMHIKAVNDFEWLKQARFFFRDDENRCIVSITDVDFIYQNESLGNTDRLVITPLTDRCYITLAQALGMSMGGAPAGPAGTGKTETTKDMGKALGKYVVVFNCSDQMDFRGLGRIYKGLAQSGSWGCFDEFNRIELPVLSVAAQQIYIVLMAKKERKTQFIFSDGDIVSLNPEFGLFLTMNPGYAGRQELPENLKVQFRTVAMMVPDRQIIMRVKLASCGFKENVLLAQKFFVLYKLCEEQLSKQVHYDFGLRNILSVLRTLGSQKRARPSETESNIVMRVLRDMNLSKLVDEDEPLFLSLISDLFPGIQLDSATYAELQAAIATNLDAMKLINHPAWNLKVVQLYETQLVRHGMMALGPTGSGKTKCINVLMKAMADCGAPHREMRMNPKAITAPQMFGRLDVATNDWTDGIFSTLWRRTLKTKKTDNVWLILDGPVDAIWIENLNSVLDDNKTLTLANGDRITMAPNCKILFEVHNIDNASPATVSRNGMVYISSSSLNWRPILQGWLNHRSAHEAEVLLRLFDKVFADLYDFATQNLSAKMLVLECMQIKQACELLQGLIPSKDDKTQCTEKQLEKLFIFSLMWSIGALMELEDRAKLEGFLMQHESKLNLPPVKDGQTIFEFVPDAKGEWQHWNERVEEYIYASDYVPEFSSILVPNVDNVRTNFLIDLIAKQNKAVLLIGEQGTAKTVMIKGYQARYNPEEQLTKSFNFSSATLPVMFQRTIESYVDKRMGSTYGPPGGRRMTCFIDDVNMPVINEWGDQVTNEITRQMMEMQGMYSLEKPGDFLHIVDIQLMAAMIQPGGGRNDIPERLKRQFSIFNCTLPSNASIDKIFGIIGSGYFCSTRFTSEVCEMVELLVPATRVLWQRTKVKMLPTPAKFHYIFNLRDLSRIWEGMLKIAGDECRDKRTILSLWKHECTRVIADRFTNSEDADWFIQCIIKTIKSDLGDEYLDEVDEEPYFVDFLQDAPEPTGEEGDDADLEAPKIYEKVPNMDALRDRLASFMLAYNESVRGAHIDLVFFKDAMTHLIKVSRIICTPRGNALLVGVGGSGKQSLTRLASFIAGYKIFQITLTRSYNSSNLMDDLKFLYRVAGLEGKGITFVFTDNEIKDEAFLEYLNNVLSSGEVSNLFAKDELDEITGELFAVMKRDQPKRPPTAENLYDFFISRSRNNLHCVLCFSPVGEKFRNRSLKFPGLISGCTMDWFNPWPKDALVAVASHFLMSYNIVATKQIKQQLVQTMGVVHDNVAKACVDYFNRFRRQTHVTPKSYLSFLDGYKKIYSEQHGHIGELAERMNTGLEKLIEASVSVDELSKELVVKEKELEVANKKADSVLIEVTQSAQAAEKVKAGVLKVKDKAQAIVDEINQEKEVAEGKLAAAKPALAMAEAALQTIKAAHISTVRKLAKPPHLIMRIMDAVLLLFQKSLDQVTQDPERLCCKPSWSESLKLMSSGGFLQTLQTFPKDSINGETVELLAPYLNMEDFTFESAKKVCGDVAGLLSWTRAMATFYEINKEVLPLKANLAIQEAKLNLATAELDTAQAQLDEKQRELDKVQAMYDAAMSEKQTLLDDAESCRRKMTAASALIGGLAGEKIRWTQQSKEFKSQIERLIGDVVLCTGFLSYSGPFNQEFRNKLQTDWQNEMTTRKIPFNSDINITAVLVDNATIGEWNLQGLPTDDLSIQNGIITTKASRYPLLIDPQGQGKNWIKNREIDAQLQSTSLNHKWFRTHLEDALSLGRPLLLENIEEELDPALDNILEKNFIKSGSTYKVKVGDKEVDVMNTFYLYITTKLPNPRYTPEISAKTSIIDFTVTSMGLEDQLLGRVIQTEKQELEAERTKLVEDVTANKRKMQQLEDNLLYKLTSTKGSLVDDESLIQVLATTKNTASEVSEKLAIAADTEIKINLAREEFRPVASRGSILYFLICEMSMVNCMYQTSLTQFLKVFDLSMAKSEKSPVNAKRIHSIIEYLTFEVFRYTCRGLYENHKFLFTLLLTLKIDLNKAVVHHADFQIFIKGGAALDLNAVQPKPCKWILDMTWLNIVELSKIAAFSDILNQIPRNEKAWKAWFDTDAPEEELIPDGYTTKLDTFKTLLLIRSWCPDRTMAQARKYIADSMGQRYADAVLLDLEATWGESDQRVPLVCFLSMGSDPTNQIELLAKKHQLECRAISMGQGQEVHARKLLNNFMQSGGWVLLQNCHLGLNFLEEMLETIQTAENPHDSFRVWISTEVHPQFPISLLQASIKFTNEPPQGIKAGLKRTYVDISQDFLDITNVPQWKFMLYGVSFLHTVVQERRKFGPLGWNIPYEFNTSDWYASVQFCQNHLDDMDQKKGVSWGTVRYMLGEVQYGGRVTDDYDKRLLNTFAKVWFGENMFQESFEFYKGYKIPKCVKIEDYLSYIQDMPLVDSPQAFGLHSNADITYQSNVAAEVLETVMSMQPKDSGGGGGETRETVVYKMAGEMLSKLPPDYLAHEVRQRLQKMGHLQPLNIFLRQELDRMQRVIKIVRSDLTDLKLAIDGTIIMNENLRNALDNMFDARVPELWRKVSWQSSTIGFWFTEMLERNEQFSKWIFTARPTVFWMTGFFNPQGFLTAMRQEVTRAHKGWSLDSVSLCNDMTKWFKEDITSPPNEGVYIHGLSLDGASWDRRNSRLTESTPKVLFVPLPVVHMYAQQALARDPKLYQCPVYTKPNRTDLNYITFITLRTSFSPDHWTLRGVAALCDIK